MAYSLKSGGHWAYSITDLHACLVSQDNRCQVDERDGPRLVLSKDFDEKGTSTEDEADDTLLDEYISNIIFFIAENDENEGALEKLLHLSRLYPHVHHTYPSPSWLEPPSDRQMYIHGLLREIVRTLDSETANDKDGMNLLAWSIISVSNRLPLLCSHSQQRSEYHGAVAHTIRTLSAWTKVSWAPALQGLRKAI